METASPASQIFCTQCGGELHPDEGQIFLTCPYCSAAVYLDKSQVVFHWFVTPTLDESGARAALARWMASNQTVKDLDRKASILGVSFEYFPLWYFKQKTPSGKEVILLEPAAATSVTELTQLNLPAGDLRKYEDAIDPQAKPPSVPLPAALDWLQQRGIPAAELSERALVHIPIYTCKYAYKGDVFTAVVEGGTGEVFANLYPAKAEAPYLLAGGITALVYLCLALIPLASGAANGAEGAGVGLLACGGIGVLLFPFLFVLAAWVAAKV